MLVLRIVPVCRDSLAACSMPGRDLLPSELDRAGNCDTM